MSTYLPGVTDTGFNPVQYSPNFPYLTEALQKATARYETNFEKMSQGYQSIMQAPIINEGVSSKRDQYLTQIKDQLKTISASDLSIQSNVNSAENLYAPFWEDKEMLAHIKDSKARMSEYEKQKSIAQEHPDYDNSTPMTVMNYYMNNIRKSKDPNVIGSTPLINATPLKNNPKEFQEWIKKNGWKQEYSVAENGRIYTQVNGDKSLHSYDELYRTYLGNSAQEQYNMYGEYYKIQGIQQIQKEELDRTGKELTEQEALSRLPDFYVKEQLEDYDNRKKSLDAELLIYKDKADKALENNDANAYEEYLNKGEEIVNSIKNIDKEYKILQTRGGDNEEDVKKYNDIRKSILSNPTGYFANIAFNKDATTAARMAASNQSLKIEKDQAALDQAKLQQEASQFNQTLEFQYKELQANINKTTNQNLNAAGIASGKTTVNEKGEIVPLNNLTPTIVPGQSNVSLTDATTRFESLLSTLQNQSMNELVDALQSTQSKIVTDVISPQDVSIIAKAYQTGDYKSKDYVEALARTKNNLKAVGGLSDNDLKNVETPSGLFNSIVNYQKNAVEKDFKQLDLNIQNRVYDDNLKKRLDAARVDYARLTKSQQQLNNIYAYKKEYDDNVNKRIAKNPDAYKNISIKKKDGTYGLITAQNLVDAFPRYEGNKKVKLPYEMMQAYLNGTLKVIDDYEGLEVGYTPSEGGPTEHEYGQKFIKKYGFHPYVAIDPVTGIKHQVGDIVKQYGKPEVLKKNFEAGMKKFVSDIPPSLQKQMQEETGKMGRVITYTSDPSKKDDYADRIAFDFFNNLNGIVVQEDDKYKILHPDDDMVDALQQIAIDLRSNPMEALTSVQFHPIGVSDPSKRNVTLVYDKQKALELIGKNDKEDYKDWNGELTFEIRDDANVTGFPSREADSFYNLLLNNKQGVKSTSSDEKFGIKYHFYKDQNNQIRYKAGYQVVVTDPDTKEVSYIWKDSAGGDYLESGGYNILPAQVSIDEFLNSLQLGMTSQANQNMLAMQKALDPKQQPSYSNKSRIESLGKKYNNVFIYKKTN